jgi:glutamate formiminotransferase / formiminotetrahydrofolate cyclodeaminase
VKLKVALVLRERMWTQRVDSCLTRPPPVILLAMPSTLVECVPNFSEGRDPAKVDAIVEAMKIPGVYLLDREMDSDHNRCVITLVGEREAIQEAAIRGVGKAAELIDLTKHQGAHPRMGAADVVPFIPIDGVTIEDCVAMARHVGAEIAKRFQIPVYLYEAAAATPERQNLEIFAAASSKAFAPRLRPIPRASPISASLACIPRRAQRSLARASFSLPTTSS